MVTEHNLPDCLVILSSLSNSELKNCLTLLGFVKQFGLQLNPGSHSSWPADGLGSLLSHQLDGRRSYGPLPARVLLGAHCQCRGWGRRTRRWDRGVHSGRPSLGRGQRLHLPLGRNSGCRTTIPCAELHLPRGRNSRTDDTTQRWQQGLVSPTPQPPVRTRARQQAPPHRTYLPLRCRPGLRPARPVRGGWWRGRPTARQASKAPRARGCRRQARHVVRIPPGLFLLGLAPGRSSWRRRHWRIWQWTRGH